MEVENQTQNTAIANTAMDHFYRLIFVAIIIGIAVCIFKDPYFFHIDAENSYSKIKRFASIIVYGLWSRPFAVFLVFSMLNGLRQVYFPSKNVESSEKQNS